MNRMLSRQSGDSYYGRLTRAVILRRERAFFAREPRRMTAADSRPPRHPSRFACSHCASKTRVNALLLAACSRVRMTSLGFAALFIVDGSLAGLAQAQSFYDGKTITIVTSTGIGGSYDVLARAIARYMPKY